MHTRSHHSASAGRRRNAPKPRKHLIDPATLGTMPRDASEAQSLTQVQRWVASSLAVTTILHLSVGLVIAALYLPDATLSSQIGLNVIAGAFGVIAVAAGLVIHRGNLASPWLAVGLIPGIVGIWLVVR
jgi:hypothetical protein